MGVLSQICIVDYFAPPKDGVAWGPLDDDAWFSHMSNATNWMIHPELDNFIMCGNNTGAGACPEKTVCLAVSNPNFFFFPKFVLFLDFCCYIRFVLKQLILFFVVFF